METINRELKEDEATLRTSLERLSALPRQVPKVVERPLNAGCLYFIGEAGNPAAPTKVGYTTKLQQRLKSLQTANAALLEIRRTIFVLEPEAEKRAHTSLQKYHIRRGWFNLTPEIIAEYTDMNEETK